jgi:chorismate--pyruvate lyase
MSKDPVFDWLLDESSLTARLKRTCKGQFSVQVVGENLTRPMSNEAQRLGMRSGSFGRIRQVRLMCDDTPVVFARTVIPLSTLTGRLRCLTHLGSRPLGAFLFADPGMRREALEIAQLTPSDRLFDMATSRLTKRPASIWGRRSVFYLDDKPLMVSEIFLPGLFK